MKKFEIGTMFYIEDIDDKPTRVLLITDYNVDSDEFMCLILHDFSVWEQASPRQLTYSAEQLVSFPSLYKVL